MKYLLITINFVKKLLNRITIKKEIINKKNKHYIIMSISFMISKDKKISFRVKESIKMIKK